MKKICVIDRTNIKLHPPVLSLLNTLEHYKVTIISSEYEGAIVRRYPNYDFIGLSEPLSKNRLIRNLQFRRRCRRVLKDDFDLIWIATGDTAIWLKDLLKKKTYVLNIFELYDKHPSYLKRLKSIALGAKKVVVPEYNRAHIFRTWFHLPETPVVIPNKYSDEELHAHMSLEGIDCRIPLDSKIILYQGIASKERNLNELCEAVRQLKGFTLVMMCSKSDYLDELMRKYDFIVHQPFVTPPDHLAITSYAHIGVVTYEHYSLNTIFCAPNKIWEYASIGLPMLANAIPGLQNTVDKFHAGICVDMCSTQDIIKGIQDITDNYDEYTRGAKVLFNSVNIKNEYKSLITSLLNE